MGKPAGLTAREHMVAQLAADGLSNKAIARELGLREGTVKVHMTFQRELFCTVSDKRVRIKRTNTGREF
jgi:ATP/maltotriose-dependent transcriptional regulator MalT